MMRWVKIEDVGDTEFLIEEQVDPSGSRGSERGIGAPASDCARRSGNTMRLPRPVHVWVP